MTTRADDGGSFVATRGDSLDQYRDELGSGCRGKREGAGARGRGGVAGAGEDSCAACSWGSSREGVACTVELESVQAIESRGQPRYSLYWRNLFKRQPLSSPSSLGRQVVRILLGTHVSALSNALTRLVYFCR